MSKINYHKLSEEDKIIIAKSHYDNNESILNLSFKYNVSESIIVNICNNYLESIRVKIKTFKELNKKEKTSSLTCELEFIPTEILTVGDVVKDFDWSYLDIV